AQVETRMPGASTWVSTISASAASARAASVAWASALAGRARARAANGRAMPSAEASANLRERRDIVVWLQKKVVGAAIAAIEAPSGRSRKARAPETTGCPASSSDPASASVHRRGESTTEPVAKRRRLAHAPAHEVRPQARTQRATVVEAERARGVHGRAAQRFGGRQPEMRAGQLHRLAQRQQGRCAGV